MVRIECEPGSRGFILKYKVLVVNNLSEKIYLKKLHIHFFAFILFCVHTSCASSIYFQIFKQKQTLEVIFQFSVSE